MKLRYTRKKNMRESYSDIDQNNVWDAYDIALEYLGADELCMSLAKAMGTGELESNLKYIFRSWDIPFMDDDEDMYDEPYKRLREQDKEDISDIDDIADSLVGLSMKDAQKKLEKLGFKLNEYGVIGGGVPKSGSVEYSSFIDKSGKYEIVIKYELIKDSRNSRKLNSGSVVDAYATEK